MRGAFCKHWNLLEVTRERRRRERKPNWTTDETLYLTSLVEKKHILKGELGHTVTYRKKVETWVEIAGSLNAAFPNIRRTQADCERQWCVVQRKSLLNIAAHKKQRTGTGKNFLFSYVL